MKFSKLLLKLGIKQNLKVGDEPKELKKEEVKQHQEISNQEEIKEHKYPQSIFELIKKHGNEEEAQDVIIKRLKELDEVARGYALDSLMDCFGEDPKTINLLNKYLKSLTEDDKNWALRDFAFHHGDLHAIRELIGEHIPVLDSENKYYLLTDLAVHHGHDVDVQNLIVKHINELGNQHKYDILYCLSHLHGLNQNVQNLISSNLKDLTETQIKEIFRGLVPQIANKIVGNHLNSLSEKNRGTLIKNASETKEGGDSRRRSKVSKKEKSKNNDELEKIEIVLLDLGGIKKSKNNLGEESFDVMFNNPVKIYPYVDEKNEDTQIGDAFLTVRDNKIYATVTLCPPLRKSMKNVSNMLPIYKPSGNLAIYKGGAKHMSVDFIYMVF